MFKTTARILNFKTLFLILGYLFFREEGKSFLTYEIKEDSMNPELMSEDYVIAIKKFNSLNRGDIVIYKNEEKGFDVVKRIIGLPGETISTENGKVLINSTPLESDWSRESTDDFVQITLNENQYFVLGDNRKLSTSDSRTLGAIDQDKIMKVKYRYWPLQRVRAYE
jgi:signal peptidase I